MRNERLERILTDIGLSPAEARLYLSMLASGPSSVMRIAKLSGLKRTTVYSVIERLQQLGIVRADIRGLKRLVAAEPPERLEAVLAARKELLERHLGEFGELAWPSGRSSFLKYYEGLPAVEGIYEELLEKAGPGDEYLALSDETAWENADRNFFLHYQEHRAKTPFRTRLILRDSPAARKVKERGAVLRVQVRLLPSESLLTTNLVVVRDRVIIHQLVPPPMAIVIENEHAIQMHREMFEIIWNSLPG